MEEVSTHHFVILHPSEESLTLENPLDTYIYEDDTLTIDVVRHVYTFFSTNAFGGNGKVGHIRVRTVTLEAQNALLKLTEEMSGGNRLFLHMSPHTIIPTLRSRAHIVNTLGQKQEETKRPSKKKDTTAEFLASGPAGRIKLVQKYIKGKDHAEAGLFIERLAVVIRSEDTSMTPQETARALSVIHETRSALDRNGISLKLLLEYLSLILPKYV
ncbi:MAG TPA: hypothetical protein PLF31_00605 [Candidatus Paceibacterota bacterium]|nr:hypothetical protein [Candidatus Paceibacterota bacterium]